MDRLPDSTACHDEDDDNDDDDDYYYYYFIFLPLLSQGLKLRTVPTIVIAHTFCASRDTWISYR